MQLQQILALMTEINEKYNLILANAKTIDELEEQLDLLANSFVAVRVGGVTQKLQVQKIIDVVQTFAVNEMVSVGTITVDGNDVTIPAGAQWRINGVNIFSSEPTVINIPLAATGKIRTDIIVANSNGSIYKVTGTETETGEIAVRPAIPFNSVLVTQINVTDSSFDTIVETIGEAPIDGNIYGRKDGSWEQIIGGPSTNPSLPQVLAQGDRPIRYSDGDGDTILELADREKFLYNRDADFLHLPAELFPDGTELKIYNAVEIDLFGITGSEFGTILQVNGIVIDEFSGITLRAGTAVLKKISGEPYSDEFWTLTYEVYDFSKEALGLNLVDNTPDASKPVSTAQATAIANAQTYAKNYTDNLKVKTPARIAIDTNISLTGDLTVGSITLITGDVVLCLAQTDAKQNGLWTVNQTGAWTRPEDFRTGLDVSFALIPVLAGTYAGRMYSTGSGIIVGANNINLQVTTVFNWGNISGDISTQTDLIALLNTKQNNPLYLSQVDDFALLNTTALQRIFSGGIDSDGAISIVAGTRYLIRADINFIELSASVSKSLNIGFLGTSAASEVSIFIWGIITNETGLATVQMGRIANYGGVLSASSSLASFGRIHMSGILECSTSGKLIPSVQINVSGVGGKTKKGSTFLAIPLGPISSSHN